LDVNKNRSTNTKIITCEKDFRYYENLIKIKDYKKINSINIFNNDFNEVINDEKMIKLYKSYPTLFFIDPFGYDIKMNNLSRLLEYKNEIILNFMFDYINRFLSCKEIEYILTDFFGCDDWKKANYLNGNEREKYLISLYKTKIKECTKAKYVFAYRLCYPNKKRTYYYLIHATNHLDGITLMKRSFTHINFGRVEYLGRKNNEMTLFDLNDYKINDIIEILIHNYKGKRLSFINLWEDLVEDTAYTDRDLRNALKEMEKRECIKVQRIDSKNFGLKGKDVIIF